MRKPMPRTVSRSRSADDGAVHHPLHVEGAHHGGGLQAQGEDEDLGQGALQALHRSHQVAQVHAPALVPGPEFRGGGELQRDAGEVLRDFREGEPLGARCGVVDHRAAGIGRLEHHEVVQVPVQDAGRAQLRQLLELEAHRPRRQVQAPGHLHEVGERGALERHGEAAAQAREVDAMAVEARHHADAGEAALGRLGLQVDRQAACRAEAQGGEHLHQARVSMLGRASTVRRASTVMRGRRGSAKARTPTR
jgi:hypothetical protein